MTVFMLLPPNKPSHHYPEKIGSIWLDLGVHITQPSRHIEIDPMMHYNTVLVQIAKLKLIPYNTVVLLVWSINVTYLWNIILKSSEFFL